MKIIYIADDGTQFDNEYDCEFYEWKLKHTHFNDILFYNEKKQLLQSDPFYANHYEQVEFVTVPNEEAVKDLQMFAKYTGFCDYESINEAGTWEHYKGSLWRSGFKMKKEMI